MGLQLNITFSSVSQNKVRKSLSSSLNTVGAETTDTLTGLKCSLFHHWFADCAGCCEPSAQCDKELWVMWLRQRLPAAHNRCREDQPHLSLHPGMILWHVSSCFYFHLVLPQTATRWQLELEVNLQCHWLLLVLLFFTRILHPISTTWVKCLCQQPGQTWKVSADYL